MKDGKKILESLLFVINSIIGTSLTIEDVSNVIGLIILSFQLILVIYNVILKLYSNYKKGKMEDNDKIVQNAVNQLEDMKKKGRDDDGN